MRTPEWWDWDLELTPHLERRMEDRDFNEVDLRAMLHAAHAMRPDLDDGRWVVETRFRRQPWEVIVEPDEDERIIVVITAYRVE